MKNKIKHKHTLLRILYCWDFTLNPPIHLQHRKKNNCVTGFLTMSIVEILLLTSFVIYAGGDAPAILTCKKVPALLFPKLF
jgi:hypothetical protein